MTVLVQIQTNGLPSGKNMHLHRKVDAKEVNSMDLKDRALGEIRAWHDSVMNGDT